MRSAGDNGLVRKGRREGRAGSGGLPGEISIPGYPRSGFSEEFPLFVHDYAIHDHPLGKHTHPAFKRCPPAPAVQVVGINSDCLLREEGKVTPVSQCKTGRRDAEDSRGIGTGLCNYVRQAYGFLQYCGKQEREGGLYTGNT